MSNEKTEQQKALYLIKNAGYLVATAKTQQEKDLAWSKKRLAMRACGDANVPYLEMLDAYVYGYNKSITVR